jgi:hypothetical protein
MSATGGGWRSAPRALLSRVLAGLGLVASVSGSGCASRGAPGPVAAVAAEQTPPRRGLGVSVDPELELPAAVRAGTAESGLVVLSAPVDVRPALRTVDAFFEAVSAESTESIERLLDRAAHTRAGPKARPEPALTSWRRRFDRLDYLPLATEVVYRAADTKVYTAGDASAPGGAHALPITPKGDEILVRVFPVGQAASKLLGSEIDFVLRPSTEGYKIAEMIEDFRLP